MPYVFNPFTGNFDDTLPLEGGKLPASYLPSYALEQDTLTFQTSSLAAGASQDFSLSTSNAYILTSVTASTPTWLRVYGTEAARTADTRTEPGGTFPSPGSEFYAELTTDTAPETIRLAPVPTILGTSGVSYFKITNEDTISRTIDLSLTIIKLVV